MNLENTTKSKKLALAQQRRNSQGRFEIRGKISEGSFGTVYEGTDLTTDKAIIMKICPKK
jgi:hypothetical protein